MISNISAHAAGWEKLPPVPEPVAGLIAGCVNGKILVLGGTNWRGDVKRWLDNVWLFDPATKAWHTGPKLPHPIAYAGFASDGTRLYIAGGADGQRGRKEIYVLDDQFKLTLIGELPQPVVFGGAALRDGALFVFGGTPDPDDWNKGSNQSFTVNLSDGKASALAPLSALDHAIGIPVVTSAGDRIHVFTDAWIDGAKNAHNVAEAFMHESATNTWRTIAPYPFATRGVASVLLDDHRIYIAGGYGTDEEGFVDRAFIYDTKTARYTPANPLPKPLNTTLVKCGEYVYLFAGEDQIKHRTDACYRIRLSDLFNAQ